MKFKSKLAQEALSIILEDAKNHSALFNHKSWAKFHNEALARAIEVAAKIEIDEKRNEIEEMRGWIPAAVESDTCEHDWTKMCEDAHGIDYVCRKCNQLRTEKP